MQYIVLLHVVRKYKKKVNMSKKTHKQYWELFLDKIIYAIGFITGLILFAFCIVRAIKYGNPGMLHWYVLACLIVYFGYQLFKPDVYEPEDYVVRRTHVGAGPGDDQGGAGRDDRTG